MTRYPNMTIADAKVGEPYDIKQFAPQVPGARFLGHWEMVVPAKKSAG